MRAGDNQYQRRRARRAYARFSRSPAAIVPNCAPMTPPATRIAASTMSTVLFWTACRIVANAADEHDLKQRRADDDARRHAQEIDHRRDHNETTADAHDRRHEADKHADDDRRQYTDVKLRALEAHLERQPVDPGMLAGLARRQCNRPAAARGARCSRPSTIIIVPTTPRNMT